MAVANLWGAAAAAPLLHPKCKPLREARHISFDGATLLRLEPRGDRGLPLLSCCCSNTASTSGGGDGEQSCSSGRDWNFWTRHFSKMDQAENLSSTLKSQLIEAVENEDFSEAAKLKTAITEVTSNDSLAKVLLELKNAIEGEQYSDASRLSKLSSNRLIGWWAGWGEGADDPFGRIVRITPAFGRFVATSYSLREVLDGSIGCPAFEIFFAREDDGTCRKQVVVLQQVNESSTHLSSSVTQTLDCPALSSTENSFIGRDSSTDVFVGNSSDGAAAKEDIGASRTNDKHLNSKHYSKEFLNDVMSFLKEKIPGFKVKMVNVTASEEINMDMESPSEDTKNKNRKTGKVEYNVSSPCQDSSSDARKNIAKQLFVSDVIHKKEDALSKFIRVPAEIKDVRNDSFMLHAQGKSLESGSAGAVKPPKVRVAAVSGQPGSGIMIPDITKALLTEDKSIFKVSKEVQEVIKYAFAHAQKRNTLPKATTFKRLISNDNNALDPLDGLYVGGFGPYGAEVVRLQRKYGNWNDSEESDSEMELFEYVEATKLTGDLIVPAGQVTFRAKIDREYLVSQGMFPKDLGVVSFYGGQGRIAEPGFRNPKWVDGQLLKLNGQSSSPLIELGFHYLVPDRRYLVLLERLQLPA